MGVVRKIATGQSTDTSSNRRDEATPPQVGPSRERGSIRGALITGAATLLAGAATLVGGFVISESNNEAATTAQVMQRQFQQEEERESIACGDVFLRLGAKATQDPGGVARLYGSKLEHTLLSAEEREYCPDYPQVLQQVQPKR